MKQPEEEYTQVHCTMKDCIFYLEVPINDTEVVFCKHPDKTIASVHSGCPLYRLDWAKRVKLNKEK